MELVSKEEDLTKRFYLTDGTALSEFYFQHRLSEDIDLFSENEFDVSSIESFLKGHAPKIGTKSISREQFLGLKSYKLKFEDESILKIDFNYYPFPRIETEKGKIWKGLSISSLYDIAVNKLHTISMRSRTRDYIDLYFIFTHSEYKPEEFLSRMRIDSQAKFDWPLESVQLMNSFTRVLDIKKSDLPKMLVPFNPKKMEDYFLNLAKKLKSEIFR
ncbi:hypothetical protein A3D77_05935 [Candidatus Gottesmanbacteria bacterium RIFCSPHIGHO2_02_FULL_39_11]|uniref:Nucleotidyl transferase AbiEii/AbiGii toxin family protein n=1 Tax=Candidatus Gottesmanbacteria bacterium RIFCSPHIGHO2_02_FULL_39_11 TaxID=1798382 RepID=A0A1F5ZTA0_9BACT|nr:MAG: hypothetical protein A3D77_05935 [Candidatus Gottesmanbacteria bacterium RIFCSPHIGHO2_02_FULL_39_11]